jgi:hypothetical protein
MVRTRFFGRRTVRVGLPSLLLCGVLAGVALFAGSTAHAAACSPTVFTAADASCDITGSVTVVGGGIMLEAPATLAFGSITLNGQNQSIRDTTTNDDTYVVNDASGTSLGWNVTATATQFTCTATCGVGTDKLPTAAFSTNGSTSLASATTAPTVACTVGTTGCTPAVAPSSSAITYPVALTGTAKIFQAKAGTGMGSNTISNAEWWLAIAPNTVPGTYTSTITLATNSAP